MNLSRSSGDPYLLVRINASDFGCLYNLYLLFLQCETPSLKKKLGGTMWFLELLTLRRL